MINIKSMALLLLVLLSFFASPVTADDHPLYYACDNRQEYFTSNSTYSSNLKLLFSTLYSNGSTTGFASFTAGKVPDCAYGLTFCRGDIDIANCSSCISTAVSNMQKLCVNNRGGGVILYDYCQLVYSNQDFLGHPSIPNSYRFVYLSYDKISADQLLRYQILLNSLLENVSDLAVKNTTVGTNQDKYIRFVPTTTRFFATGEAAHTATDITYAQMQCALDLSVRDCQFCLQLLVNTIVLDKSNQWKGRRAMGLWCNMRYDSYKFYNGKSMLRLASDRLPSSLSPTNVGNNQPSVPRLKQLAQTIRNSSAGNLGLNHTLFGRVKQIRLSSFLQHSLNSGFGSSLSPTLAPQASIDVHRGHHSIDAHRHRHSNIHDHEQT